jgi:peroxiredoxin
MMSRIYALTGLSAGILALAFTSCTIIKAPPAPQMGGIEISLEDSNGYPLTGAQVFLDGSLQPDGGSPLLIEATVGSHWLWAQKAGFETDSTQVEVIADSVVEATLILQPLSIGAVYIHAVNAISSAEVPNGILFLDGIPTSFSAPATLANISVGPHTFGTGMPGYDFNEIEATVNSVDTVEVEIPLTQVAWYGIQVAAGADTALICVDDRLIGLWSPAVVPDLAEGLHSFSCYREGYITEAPNLGNAYALSVFGEPISYALSFNISLWSPGVGYTEGKLAPGFSLLSDVGDSVALGGYRGRVVLITFWFRDCAPCMAEMPYIQQVFAEQNGQGFRVLAVNPMFNDDLTDLLEVRELLGLTFEMIMDPGLSVTIAYQSNQFPTNVLVDQRGVVDWYTRSLQYAELSARVQELLNQ